MIVLTTERLQLRQFDSDDGDALEHVFRDPQVMEYGEGVQTRQWIDEWIDRCQVDYYRKRGFGPWAVVTKGGLEPIGYCGLFHFPDLCGQPETEVGYRLARRCWGKGYATEAVVAVRDYAFDTLGIKRLVAMIDPGNAASLRVAEKAGMRFEREVMLEWYDYADHLYVVNCETAA